MFIKLQEVWKNTVRTSKTENIEKYQTEVTEQNIIAELKNIPEIFKSRLD